MATAKIYEKGRLIYLLKLNTAPHKFNWTLKGQTFSEKYKMYEIETNRTVFLLNLNLFTFSFVLNIFKKN